MNHTSWMSFSRTAMAAAVAVVVAAPAMAQNTSAGLSGRVLGGDGKPVAGATVTVLHVESGSSTSTTTDSEGRYLARGLRVGGPFTVTFAKGGVTSKREGVFLQLAETASLDGQIGAPVAGSSTIVITGRASDKFNNSSMGAGTNLGQRELNSLASIQRSLTDYARTDPRLSQTDKERGEISAAGQNTRFNSITIDGVTTNDTFGLESNNLPTIKQPISIDAIQSVQVNLSNYDVTQKGYTGANINAVTKSGTNEFKGSIYYVWRDDQLVGKRYNRTNQSYFDAPVFEENTKGFTLGGPIIKDTLFFFASYEEFKSSRTSPDFGPVGAANTNVGISQSAVDQAISIAKTTWNFDAGASTVPQGLQVNVKDTLLKLDWNINDNHRANLRYTKTKQDEPFIVGFSATGLSLSSWWYNQAKTVEAVVGQWFADWTPTLSTELKISKRDYDSVPTQVNGTRLPAIGLRFNGPADAGQPAFNTGNRFLNLGTENSRQRNVLRTETTDIYAGANWTLGAHELKFGLDYATNDVYNAFLQNVNGNYTFACEANSAAAPVSYSFGTVTACPTATTAGTYTSTAGVAGLPMTAAQRELAVLENFRRGLPSAFSVQSPLAGKTLDDAVAIWKYTNTGLFLQDNFKVSNDFSLMAGVRVDQQGVPTKPLFNDVAAAPTVAGSVTGPTTVIRNSGGFGVDNTNTLDGNTLVQPRLGFNWNLSTPERRAQLRGGFGLFQGAAANVWLSNPFSNTGKAVATYSCTSFGNCRTAGPAVAPSTVGTQVVFNPNPNAQPTLTNAPPAPNIDFVSSDLEQPSVWKANLAFESELPELPVVGRLTVGAEWLHTKVNTGIYYQNLNLGGATATGPDGRPLFYTPQTYSRACWSGSSFSTTGVCANSRIRALSNANFNNAIIARKTSQGGGDAITLSISQPVSSGLSWSMAYTKTTAKEVSPLTSSTSNSNWNGKNSFDPNEDVLQNSNYLIKDRINGSLSWSKAFVGNYRTSVGVFYEGRRGKPYSWTFINDMNGDGIGGNDLMYIPTGPGDSKVVFRGADGSVGTAAAATAESQFWTVVNENPALANAKGGVVGRNNSFAPWVNNFDVRISQELPGFMSGHKASFSFDILNFGNLLNKKWGRIDEVAFPSRRSFVNFNGLENGAYVYSMGSVTDFTTRQAAGESQWAVQMTVKYSF